MTPQSCDVVVIGGGLAGMVTALRAAELGLSAICLEAGGEVAYPCNTRFTMGFFNVAFRDIGLPRAPLRAALDAVTAGCAHPDLLDTLSAQAAPALAWLRGKGARLIVGNWRPGSSAMLAPPSAIGPGLNWPGRGGDVLLRRLEAALRLAGGQLLRGARALSLCLSEGRCAGVRAEVDGCEIEVHARATVICDGGFQANPELLRRYVTARPDRVLTRNAGTGRGDGLRTALEAGAATAGMGGFYGHVQAVDALHNPRLWPYPNVDMPISGGMVVRTDTGRRFADEGLGGVYVANAIARLPDPLAAMAIFDHRIWMERAIEFPLPANPLLVSAGATIHVADTLGGLAEKAGLSASALETTVSGYNEALRADQAANLDPPRSHLLWAPMPIAVPPFYAVPLVAGITYTTGGIAIDGCCRVQHQNGGGILGLYAAGSATGGREGGPRAAYTGGLSKALTFGWVAANTIAGDLGQ